MMQAAIEVLYVDSDIVIVNKPWDLLSVPGRGPDKQDCLWYRVQQQGYPTARIVHRLDYATSGLMVLALNADSHRAMSKLFEQRQVTKRYQALVTGHLEGSGEVAEPLRCDWKNRPLQIVDHQQGKPALTFWQATESTDQQSRVLLTPHTGRSHQLRVHMQWLGHAICGDRFYADEQGQAMSERLCLHAELLGFNHPITGKPLQWHAPCPF